MTPVEKMAAEWPELAWCPHVPGIYTRDGFLRVPVLAEDAPRPPGLSRQASAAVPPTPSRGDPVVVYAGWSWTPRWYPVLAAVGSWFDALAFRRALRACPEARAAAGDVLLAVGWGAAVCPSLPPVTLRPISPWRGGGCSPTGLGA